MAKKKAKKVAKKISPKGKRRAGQPKKALTSAAMKRAGATKKGKKAKAAKSAKSGGPKAKSEGPGHPRYLVVSAARGVISTTKELTAHLRGQAKGGTLHVVDCERMLVMTPLGAWAKLVDVRDLADTAEVLVPVQVLAPVLAGARLDQAAEAHDKAVTPTDKGVGPAGFPPEPPPAAYEEEGSHGIAEQGFSDRESGI